jgi:hypothetical protein
MAIGQHVAKAKAEKEQEQHLAALAAQEQAADEAAAALDADESVAPMPVGQPMTPAGALAGLTFEQIKELFLAAQGSRISNAEIADIAANAAAKAKMPENKTSPQISVFSHPEGERDRPKAKLKCRMYFGSAPIEAQTCTPAEIDALNKLTPGAYRVTKTDGAKVVVDITGQVNANRQVERLWIVIPKDDENKNGYGPSLCYLADQCCDENRVGVA